MWSYGVRRRGGRIVYRYCGRRRERRGIVLLAVIAISLLVIGCTFYVRDFYRADDAALAAMQSDNQVTVEQTDCAAVFMPQEPSAGLIFYPGGKVEYTAYAPLMRELAEEGILCVLTEMPLNLAVLDVNAAEGIPEQYPEVTNWYIGGHSLGGSMAASYVADHGDTYEGLVLLASYSTKDLRDTNLRVLSVYGSEDGVLNQEKYRENKVNLPDSAVEILVDGGNHACFGSYGEQEGDGATLISPEKQVEETVEQIVEFFEG